MPTPNPAWQYHYVGKSPELRGLTCYGCQNAKGKRIWSGGPGPRNALVWFPGIGFVVVPGRSSLRKVK